MAIVDDKKRQRFITDGFFHIPNILGSDLITQLNNISDEVLSAQEQTHFEQQRTTGSMVLIDWDMVYQYSAMTKLVAHPKMIQALAELGFAQPKFGHGRIISKPAYSPPLFWHEDGRFWDDPVSYTTQPIQCFLMYYLTDTKPENGCLRVIPGSHLNRHPLHDMASPRHTDELRTYANPDHIAFQQAEGEIDVPVKAGDLVIGFGTLFHAAHANQTDGRRTVLTMWYYPDYLDLPEPTQATVAYLERGNQPKITTVGQQQEMLAPFRINYEGEAEPIEQQWTPGKLLK